MSAVNVHAPMTARLADGLYTEAMLLADETRSYFDGPAAGARGELDPAGRVAFACESLNATTRLMQVIAWLLVRRAVEAGEMAPTPADDGARMLGESPATDRATLALIAGDARRLIEAGIELHARVRRLAEGAPAGMPLPSPARSLIERLERAF